MYMNMIYFCFLTADDYNAVSFNRRSANGAQVRNRIWLCKQAHVGMRLSLRNLCYV